MAWNKFKSFFVVNESADSTDQLMKDLEKYELPPGETAPLPTGTEVQAVVGPAGRIEFQALYDQAGIPDTDEVEALERFLGGLEQSLPEASRTAAAKAFLGAIGKSPRDVVADAGRKITVVRAVAESKRSDIDRGVAERQAAIAQLQRQIDEQRVAMEGLMRELEDMRAQCLVEESRLQGARVFFGHAGDVAVER
jgi:hypothetical protein